MLPALRSRLTYANVVATLALFVALGGSSYAALKVTGRDVPRDALTGADIKNLTGRDVTNNSLSGADVKNLTSADVRNGRLLAEDFAPGQLPKGDKGDKGDEGDRGSPGVTGYREIRETSAFDSTDSKSTTPECPAGTSLVGGGSQITGTVAGVALVQDGSNDLESKEWTALANEIVTNNSNWGLRTSIYCLSLAP